MRTALQKYVKARLVEVIIGSQHFGKPLITHNNERHTVNQSPLFIDSVTVYIESSSIQFI